MRAGALSQLVIGLVTCLPSPAAPPPPGPQMVKDVPPPVPWRSLMLRHGDLKQRLYYPPPSCVQPYEPPALGVNGVAAAARGVAKKPSKPAKKRPRKR